MNTRTTPPGVTPKASRWLMPLILVVLGAVVLVAEASQDDIGSGLAWFAVMAGSAAILAFGGRFEPVRLSRGDTEDEQRRAHQHPCDGRRRHRLGRRAHGLHAVRGVPG